MGIVANNIVATLMGSQTNSGKSNSIQNQKVDVTFQSVFAKTQSANAIEGAKKVESPSNESPQDQKEHLGKNNEMSENDGKTQKADQAPESKKTEKSTEKSDAKEVDKTDEIDTEKSIDELELIAFQERLSQLEQTILNQLSELLGISVEELQAQLEKLNLTAGELLKVENLSKLISDHFNLDSTTELLTNEEASKTLKDVVEKMSNIVSDLATELGIDEDMLRDKISQVVELSQQNGKNPNDQDATKSLSTTENVSDQSNESSEMQMKVVDTRTKDDSEPKEQSHNGNNNQSFAEVVANNLSSNKQVVTVDSSQQVVYKEVNPTELIDQIVTKAVINLNDENTSIQIQLNPENLGKVGVSVTSEQGLIKGQFVAENQVVKEMLESNMIQLKEQLEEQGIKVDKIEVTVGNSNQFFEEQKQQQDQSDKEKNNRQKVQRLAKLHGINELMIEDEVVESEALDSVSIGGEVHTVEYSA